MIQPLQSNSISFKSTTVSPALKARIEAQKALQEGTAAQTIDAQETPTQPDKLKKKKKPLFIGGSEKIIKPQNTFEIMHAQLLNCV